MIKKFKCIYYYFENFKTVMDAPQLTPQQLQQLYNWVDQIPLSRPKKNISRDFSDGVLVAEILAYYFPKLVELHNYIGSGSLNQKQNNWNLLNNKVLKKLNIQVSKNDIEQIISITPDIIERVLKIIQRKIKLNLQKKKQEMIVINTNKNKKQQIKNVMQNKDVKLIISQKDVIINELKQTIQILQLKLKKMDSLVKVKDHKIENLISKLKEVGMD